MHASFFKVFCVSLTVLKKFRWYGSMHSLVSNHFQWIEFWSLRNQYIFFFRLFPFWRDFSWTIFLVARLKENKSFFFFDTAPSFEAWETHRYLKNRLGIVRARGGGLLDHPYAPCHPPSVPPTEEHLVGHLTNYCHQMSSCGLYILFLYCYIEYHMS